jgi:putative membrane protein
MPNQTTTLYRITTGLLTAYILLTFYSVIAFLAPLPRLPGFTFLLTLIAFVFSILHAGQRWGWGQAGLLVGLCFVISLLFESIGVATGAVYGPYHYTNLLGPKFLDLVPYLIPLAWFMMMYPSLVIARTLSGSDGINRKAGLFSFLGVAVLGGLVMTAWDLVMDPMMVKAGNWVWDGAAVTRPYFGVPLQNYWGWWLTTFVTFCLFFGAVALFQAKTPIRVTQTHPEFDRLAIGSYIVTGLGTVFTAFIIGLDGPALVGLFAMLPWAVLAWQRLSVRDARVKIKTPGVQP